MPGLHISLGVFLKFFEFLSDACTQHELQIADKEAESDGNTGKTEYDVYVQTLRKSLQEKKAAEALLAEAQAAQDYASYIVTLGGTELSQANPNPLVVQLLVHAQDLRQKGKEKVKVYLQQKILNNT